MMMYLGLIPCSCIIGPGSCPSNHIGWSWLPQTYSLHIRYLSHSLQALLVPSCPSISLNTHYRQLLVSTICTSLLSLTKHSSCVVPQPSWVMGRQYQIQQMLCVSFELIKVWETQQRLSEFNEFNAIIINFLFVCSLKLLSLWMGEDDS